MDDFPVNPYASEATCFEQQPENRTLRELKNLRVLAHLCCWPYAVLGTASILHIGIQRLGLEIPGPLFKTYVAVSIPGNSAALIFFLCWTYRAAWNARVIDPARMDSSPRKAAFSYFLPIYNLFMPYRAMIRIASISADSPSSALVKVWWVLVLGTYLVPIYFVFFREERQGPMWGYAFEAEYWTARFITAIVAILLVMRITTAQMTAGERSHHSRNGSSA